MKRENLVSEQPNKWNAVSIRSIDGSYADFKNKGIPLKVGKINLDGAKNICSLHFDDIEKDLDGCVLCNEKHILNILEFCRKLYFRDECLFINCRAGISRSSAICAIILLDAIKFKSEFPIEDMLGILTTIKDINLIHPNIHILELGIKTLALNQRQELKWKRDLYSSSTFSKLYNI